MPLMRTVRPSTPGSPPNSRCQAAWVTSTRARRIGHELAALSGARPLVASSCVNSRPRAAVTPSVSKKLGSTQASRVIRDAALVTVDRIGDVVDERSEALE